MNDSAGEKAPRVRLPQPGTPSPAPVPLRRAIDAGALCRDDPCEAVHVLGSFWPNYTGSFESHVVKSFKECSPVSDYQPHITELCEFYAGLISCTLGEARFDWVARVLSSSEREPDRTRPQALLADVLCSRLGARSICQLFFRSDSRLPMRRVGRLAGAEALKGRIQYVSQDLFIRPSALGGRALLIDDICNTGASTRIYAWALKEMAGVEGVVAVNLAATRFDRGKDGRGRLNLDVAALQNHPALRPTWLDSGGLFHALENCPSAQPPLSPNMRFICERRASPCPACSASPKPSRRWWQIGRQA